MKPETILAFIYVAVILLVGRSCTATDNQEKQIEILRDIRDRLPSPPTPETAPPQPADQ